MGVCRACATPLSTQGQSAFRLASSRGPRQWMRCGACGSYFDTTPFNPAEEASHHLETRPSGLALNEFKSQMFRSVLRLLSRYIQGEPVLLDVGCSYGGFLQQAKQHGYRVIGMDIAGPVVEQMRADGFDCHVAASVDDLRIPNGSLDVVSVLDSNYYWPNQIPELRAIRRKLRPGGLLVMRVADKSWMLTCGLAVMRWLPRLGDRLSRRAVNDHRVSIPVRSLLRIARSEGFEILYASPRGALHSRQTSAAVRLMFVCGYLWWRATGRYLAPGCLILGRKTP